MQQSQLFRYLMTGGMTTLINYFIYFVLTGISLNYLAANSLAWIGAVVFAYTANRRVVFQSTGDRRKEFLGFFTVRLATLFLENIMLYAFVESVGIAEMPAKIAVSVITVILNYFACKYSIFKEGGVTHE